MPKKTPPASKKVKAKPASKNPAPKTDADKIRALEEQLAQRDAELAVINSIQASLASKIDFQGIIDAVGDKLGEIFTDGNVGIGFVNEARNVVSFPYVVENGKRLDYFEINLDVPSVLIHSIKRRRPLVINKNISKRFGTDVFNFPGIDQHDLKAWLSVPLISGDKFLGGIALRNWQRENAYSESDVRLLQTIASSMSVALENVNLFEETQRLLKKTEQRATELQIINNIGQTLTESGDLESMIQRVGERIQEALNINNIAISIFDKETEHIIAPYMVRNGEQIALTKEHFSIHAYKIMMRASARRGGVSWVVKGDEVERFWHRWRGSIGEDVPKSVVVLPLLAGREVIGGISLADYEKENAFTDLSLNLLETIASNMGTAVQNVRLFEETQRLLKETEQRATELQIINNIGQTLTEGLDLNSTLGRVGERLREVLKVEHIGITAVDPKTGFIVAQYLHSTKFTIDQFSPSKFKSMMRISARGGGKSWVLNTNAEKSWEFAYDVHEGNEIPKSFVGLPLLAGREMIGGILFGDYEKENAFTNISIGMLETIASNLGTAIQNVRLFDETQRLLKETEQRNTELTMLNVVQQALSSNLDFKAIFEAVGRKLIDIFKVQSASIYTINLETRTITYEYAFEPDWEREIGERPATSLHNHVINRIIASKKSYVINSGFDELIKKFPDSGSSLRLNPKSMCVAPIVFQKNILMGISLQNIETENFFDDSAVRLLETISNATGVALENARLFDETQRLLKETEQRATELQIINNIGQTLTEGLDLNSMIERVAERLHEVLKVDNIAITIINPNTGQVIAQDKIFHSTDPAFATNRFSLDKFKSLMRLSARGGNRSWVMNTNAEKSWRRYAGNVLEGDSVPKSFVALPLLVGKDAIGGIIFADYERENAFIDLPIRMLETIAYNMGTGIQNVLLFDETQHLLKETEQRATELQIINNIGQTLTEGGDLEHMIQRVGERIQEALNVNNIAISVFDKETERVTAHYMVRNGQQIALTEENFDMRSYKLLLRASARRLGSSWVFKDADVEKVWRKSWRGPIADDFPKSVVMLPLLAGREVIGGISLADYEKENAFTDLSLNLLETIASNMGTAVQNVRLFEETKRLFAEAEEARASAERANKAKSTFLANMSHELRTPLNAIMGFTSIVRDKSLGVLPEKQINNLEKVLASSQHLLGLINTVLDLAKIEAGRMDVIPAKFHLNALIDLCGNLSTPLLKPGVTLEKQADETIGIIYSDQDKIKQILLNLLSNAAKFTHEGRILLSVEKLDSENVNISVTDSGIGISADAIDRVFEEFQQADATTTRQYGGTGLGLPISRSLARLLGGDLTATSELGKGSTFTLTIPNQYGRKPAASSSDPQPASVQPTESQAQAESSQP